MTDRDQPTAGVALSRNDLIETICAEAGWGATSGIAKAGRIADAILAKTALRAPASDPVDADDRLAVAVEALEAAKLLAMKHAPLSVAPQRGCGEMSDHIRAQLSGNPGELPPVQLSKNLGELDHAELGRLAEAADQPMPLKRRAGWWGRKARFEAAFTPAVCRALLSDNAALRAEIERLKYLTDDARMAERDEAVTVLTEIAKGETPPEQHGHYLAHRQAVKAARTFLQSLACKETGND